MAATLDAAADVAKDALDIAAQERHCNDAEHRDESEDQAVFCKTLAAVIGEKAVDGSNHGILLVKKVASEKNWGDRPAER